MVFGKSGSFADLLRQLQQVANIGGPDLEPLIEAVVNHPSAKPRLLAWMLEAAHPRVREAGRSAIGRSGENAVELLLDAMATCRERQVARELGTEVLSLDRADLQRQLSHRLHSREPRDRRVVLDVIAADPEWQRWLGYIKSFLTDPDRELRGLAVRLLCRGPNLASVRMVLLHLLHEDEARTRIPVIHALSQAPGLDLIEPFFARLPHEEEEERNRITATLGRIAEDPRSEIDTRLVPFLADEDPAMRRVAVHLLAKLPNASQVLKTFLQRSRGLAPWLRERATSALLATANRLTGALVTLMADPDPDVRSGAMMLAARIDDPQVLPAVRDILTGDDDWWVRSMAAEILAKFSTPATAELLISQLHDSDLRYAILAALGQVQQASAIQPLLAALQDPTAGIRRTAVRSLSHYPSESTAKALHQLAIHDPDQDVRVGSLQALREFGAPARKIVESVEQQLQAARESLKTAPLELEMVREDLRRPAL